MKISNECTVELVQVHASDEMVVRAARISTLTEDKATDREETRGMINFLMANRHGSPFEHNLFTFRVEAPIAVFREWHRHRVQSFNEQSGRYTEFEPHFYIPGPERPLIQEGKPGHYNFVDGSMEQYLEMRDTMADSFIQSWDAYQDMLDQGVAKEVARGVLPVYTMSSMYATMNARSLMHFLGLRRKNNIHGEAKFPSFPMHEIDECAEMVEKEFARVMPITWNAFCKNGRVSP